MKITSIQTFFILFFYFRVVMLLTKSFKSHDHETYTTITTTPPNTQTVAKYPSLENRIFPPAKVSLPSNEAFMILV